MIFFSFQKKKESRMHTNPSPFLSHLQQIVFNKNSVHLGTITEK